MAALPIEPFRKTARFAVILCAGMACILVGYAGGRYNIVRKINRVLAGPNSTPELSSDHLPAGPPLDVTDSETYAGLNRLLDERLLQQLENAASWRPMLESATVAEVSHIAEQIRAEYLALLNPWPGPRVDLDAQTELWFSRDSVDAYLVEISTHPGIRLTSALLIPKSATLPAPTMLLLHGYQGSLQSVVADLDYHHGFGFELAQQGFIVLAPLRVASTINTRSTLYTKALAGGWTLDAIDLHQLVQAVNYLFTLQEVDQKRVGVYGISLGGQHALRLGALDARLSLVLSSAYFANRFDWLFKRENPTAVLPPGSAMTTSIHPVDNVMFEPGMGVLMNDLNLVALIQPRFLGIVSGTEDPRHKSASAEFEDVVRLYRHVGYPERATFLQFEGGHETSVATVLPFLRMWANTVPAG